MEEVEIKFTGINFRDAVSLENASQSLKDVFIDAKGYIRSRGGLSAISFTGDPLPANQIDGLYYWSSKNLVMVVVNGRLFKIDSSNVVTELGSGLTNDYKASFAITRTSTGEESLVVANNSDIYIYKPLTGTFTNIFSGDSQTPRNVIQLEFLDQYIIALSADSRFFHYSVVGDPENWSALDFGVAEAKADIINQIKVVGSFLYLYGEESVEVYYNNGVTPFERVSGSVLQTGLIAKDTTVTIDNQLFWLDSNRRIVVLNGNSYVVISDSIDRLLEDIDVVDDAYAYPLYHQGKSFYVITFPTASRINYDGSDKLGITLVYDLSNKQFTEFAKWETSGSNYSAFPILSQTYAVIRREQWLGDTAGNIFTLDKNVYKDNSAVLRPEYLSANLDLGSLNKKRINKLLYRMQAGDGTTQTTIQLNYRKDGESVWQSSREQSLTVGNSSLNQFVGQVNGLGIARVIQLSIASSSDAPLVLGSLKMYVDGMTI